MVMLTESHGLLIINLHKTNASHASKGVHPRVVPRKYANKVPRGDHVMRGQVVRIS